MRTLASCASAAVLCLLLLIHVPLSLPVLAQDDPNGVPEQPADSQPESESADQPADQRKLLTLEQAVGRGDRRNRVNLNAAAPTARFVDGEAGPVVEIRRGRNRIHINPETLEESPAPAATPSTPHASLEAFRAHISEHYKHDTPEALQRSMSALRPTHRGAGSIARFRGDLLYWSEASGVKLLHAATSGRIELEDLSPDGSAVSAVKAGDLIVLKGADATQQSLTSDGAGSNGDFLNGKLDWMYQEEIYGRGRWKGHWWSPDSKTIASLRFDQARVTDFTVINHLPPDGSMGVVEESFKYPKAGTPLPIIGLTLVKPDGSEPVTVDLSGYGAQEFLKNEILVVDVHWSPTGRLLIQVQDRIQSWLELCEVDPATGTITRLIREESEDWVDKLGAPQWLADGSFLWQSQRTGYQHIYHCAADGKLKTALTSGSWDVERIVKTDDRTKDGKGATLWFYANKERNINRDLYRVELDGKGLTRLCDGDGTHSVEISSDGRFLLDTWSSMTQRPELVLRDGTTGKALKSLGRASNAIERQYKLSPWQLERVACRDGYEIDVTMLKPIDFNPELAYPVWMSVYTGPDIPTIRNQWRDSAFHQFLAQRGYIVLSVNVRSAGHNGHAISKQCYRALGQTEFRDLEDVAKWIGDKPWADGTKIGINGHSYGGYISAICLTNSKAWALGIAQSGVYDWRGYDAVYAERYMGTPQSNKDGYDAGSAIKSAKNLSGHLVLTHGTMDENAHMQSTLQLAYALQKANKPFDLMLYPRQRHGYSDPDINWWHMQMVWRKIQEHLPSPVNMEAVKEQE